MIAAERGNNSQSPSSPPSFTHKLSAFGAKLTRTLSGPTDVDHEEDKDSVSTKLPSLGKQEERSLSRGRDAFYTGRGGAGNIRPASASRTRPDPVPEDFRGREPKTYSTGRGGVGNIRSPSRKVDDKPPVPASLNATEQEIIRNHIVATQDTPHSSGRGGLGNITSSSRSRSRSRGPALTQTGLPVHSTGRGGVGNIFPGSGGNAFAIEEKERQMYSSTNEEPVYHSTGRGGVANLTSGAQPPPDEIVHTLGEYGSTGRGGAGNIVQNN